MKIVVTIETEEVEEEQVRDYLEFIKSQVNKYSQGLMNYTVNKCEPDVDAEFRTSLELSKKAPCAKGA